MGIFAPHAGQATKQTRPGNIWGASRGGGPVAPDCRVCHVLGAAVRDYRPAPAPSGRGQSAPGPLSGRSVSAPRGKRGDRACGNRTISRRYKTAAGSSGSSRSWTASHLSDRYGRPSAPFGGGPGRSRAVPFRTPPCPPVRQTGLPQPNPSPGTDGTNPGHARRRRPAAESNQARHPRPWDIWA